MNKLKIQNRLLFTIAVIAYIIALFVYGFWDYTYRKNAIIENIDTKLYNSAAALKYILPDNFHDRAIDEKAISINEDKYIAHKLTKLIKETGFKYIYTIVKKEDKLFFIATDITVDPKNKRGTWYFFPYEEADEVFFKAFDQEIPTYKTVSDQWGTVRTVIIPEKSPGGINYLACADYDISYVTRLLQKNLLRSILTIFFFLLLSVPIIIIYSKLRIESLEALRESDEKYRTLSSNIPGMTYRGKPDWSTDIISNSEILCGYSIDEFRAQKVNYMDIIHPDDKQRVFEEGAKLTEKPMTIVQEYRVLTKDGITRWARDHKTSFFKEDGSFVGVDGIVFDMTERKQVEEALKESEEKLRQSQKMESIGTLAGGIAHDFNNILSSVFGFTELALDDAKKGTLQHEHLREVLIAGNRAKDLVKQILTFSRQGDQEQKPIQVKLIVKEALKLLRASIPTTIDIKENIQSNSLVIGDSTQIHQVLMNLCTNAAHAMEDDGGLLTVSLSDVEFDSEFVSDHPDLKPGPYINLTVTDTGYGISPNVMEKIFDPFFTSKEKGEGTGMGLSVVHGIVRSHGGDIYVYSEPGKGSTFKVYLPAIEGGLKPKERIDMPFPTGTEHILFIDDEPAIVNMGKRILKFLGYDVTTRTSGLEALELFKAQKDRFDLVITDMTMPQMTGDDLSKELMNIRPDIPVILCTGFSTRIDEKKALDMGIRAFVSKPILKREIAETIRKVLDG